MSNLNDSNELEWVEVGLLSESVIIKTRTNGSENNTAKVQDGQIQMLEDYIDIGLSVNQYSLDSDEDKVLIPNDNGIVIKVTDKKDKAIIEEKGKNSDDNDKEDSADKMLEELFKPSELSKLLDSMYDNQIFLPPLNILDSDDEDESNDNINDEEGSINGIQNGSKTSSSPRIQDDEVLKNCLLQFKKSSKFDQQNDITTQTQSSSSPSSSTTIPTNLNTKNETDFLIMNNTDIYTTTTTTTTTATTKYPKTCSRNLVMESQSVMNYKNPWSEESCFEMFIHTLTTSLTIILTIITEKIKVISWSSVFYHDMKFPDFSTFTFSTNVLAWWSLCNTLFGVLILIFLFTTSNNNNNNNHNNNTYNTYFNSHPVSQSSTLKSFYADTTTTTNNNTTTHNNNLRVNDLSMNAATTANATNAANTNTNTGTVFVNTYNQTKSKTIIKPSTCHFPVFNHDKSQAQSSPSCSTTSSGSTIQLNDNCDNESNITNNGNDITNNNHHNHAKSSTILHSYEPTTNVPSDNARMNDGQEAMDMHHHNHHHHHHDHDYHSIDDSDHTTTAAGEGGASAAAIYDIIINNYNTYPKRLYKRLFYDIALSSSSSSFFIQKLLEKKLTQMFEANLTTAATGATPASVLNNSMNNKSSSSSTDKPFNSSTENRNDDNISNNNNSNNNINNNNNSNLYDSLHSALLNFKKQSNSILKELILNIAQKGESAFDTTTTTAGVGGVGATTTTDNNNNIDSKRNDDINNDDDVRSGIAETRSQFHQLIQHYHQEYIKLQTVNILKHNTTTATATATSKTTTAEIKNKKKNDGDDEVKNKKKNDGDDEVKNKKKNDDDGDDEVRISAKRKMNVKGNKDDCNNNNNHHHQNGFCKNKNNHHNNNNPPPPHHHRRNHNQNHHQHPFDHIKLLVKTYTHHIHQSMKQTLTQQFQSIHSTFQNHILLPLTGLFNMTQSVLQTTLNTDLILIDMLTNVLFYMDHNLFLFIENSTINNDFFTIFSWLFPGLYDNETNTTHHTAHSTHHTTSTTNTKTTTANNNKKKTMNDIDKKNDTNNAVTDILDSVIDIVDSTEQWLATAAASVTQKSEQMMEGIANYIHQAHVLGISLDY